MKKRTRMLLALCLALCLAASAVSMALAEGNTAPATDAPATDAPATDSTAPAAPPAALEGGLPLAADADDPDIFALAAYQAKTLRTPWDIPWAADAATYAGKLLAAGMPMESPEPGLLQTPEDGPCKLFAMEAQALVTFQEDKASLALFEFTGLDAPMSAEQALPLLGTLLAHLAQAYGPAQAAYFTLGLEEEGDVHFGVPLQGDAPSILTVLSVVDHPAAAAQMPVLTVVFDNADLAFYPYMLPGTDPDGNPAWALTLTYYGPENAMHALPVKVLPHGDILTWLDECLDMAPSDVPLEAITPAGEGADPQGSEFAVED